VASTLTSAPPEPASSPHGARPESGRLASLALGIAALVCLLQAFRYHDYLLDDQFISYRYARHLVEGQRLQGVLRGNQVADVGRIEGAAQQPESHVPATTPFSSPSASAEAG